MRTKGKNNPMYGKVGAMKNKKHSEETKIRMSKVKKRRDKIENILKENIFPKIIIKPWGEENIISYNKHYCVKIIKINR